MRRALVLFTLLLSVCFAWIAHATDGDAVPAGNVRFQHPVEFKLCDADTSAVTCDEFDMYAKFLFTPSEVQFSVEAKVGACTGLPQATIHMYNKAAASGGIIHDLGVLSVALGESIRTPAQTFRFASATLANITSCAYTVHIKAARANP